MGKTMFWQQLLTCGMIWGWRRTCLMQWNTARRWRKILRCDKTLPTCYRWNAMKLFSALLTRSTAVMLTWGPMSSCPWLRKVGIIEKGNEGICLGCFCWSQCPSSPNNSSPRYFPSKQPHPHLPAALADGWVQFDYKMMPKLSWASLTPNALCHGWSNIRRT